MEGEGERKKEETTFRAIVMDKKAVETTGTTGSDNRGRMDTRLVDGRRRGVDKRNEELAEAG